MVSAFTVGGLGPKILNLHTLNLQALNLLDPSLEVWRLRHHHNHSTTSTMMMASEKTASKIAVASCKVSISIVTAIRAEEKNS